ncbi:MAG: hypothetical protein ACYC3X_04330 [Pirellulaceae bacterium]
MSGVDVKLLVKQVEELLARAGALPEEAEQAIEKLLNVVEALSADKKELTEEVQRLRKLLEQKKQAKTTAGAPQDAKQPLPNDSNHSSEKQRRNRAKKHRSARDRRSFKALTIHETIECPVDPDTLPPDAVRVEGESVIVQDIEIKPHSGVVGFVRGTLLGLRPSIAKVSRGPERRVGGCVADGIRRPVRDAHGLRGVGCSHRENGSEARRVADGVVGT